MKDVTNDRLRLLILDNMKEFGDQVDHHLQEQRELKKSYIVPMDVIRFNNGEGKVVLKETIRKKDVYILSDIGNHSCTYEMFGYTNHLGPDEHFQDIKRVISAIKGHADSITLIMPLMYSSRQHRRKGRESLDCAIALQELERLGVHNIITFDIHDPNVQNAIPCLPFENFYPTNVILSEFCNKEEFDFNNLLVVSPDTGAMDRARYYADMLHTDVGMFYKRRDLSKIVNGKNPIVAHEYMGKEVNGKNVIVVDDMIASGGSILEVAEELKKRGAASIYLMATFSMFTNGPAKFDEYYENHYFDKIYSTNLSYIPDDIKNRKWFQEVDCSNYVAQIVDCLNRQNSISPLVNGKSEILKRLDEKRKETELV